MRKIVAACLVAVSLGVASPSAGKGSDPRLPSDTGDVLVFDDGYDGATFVDLDHDIAVRRNLDGRAGDQPFRLARVGDSLVVGWGEISAAPLDGSAPHLVGESTIFIPAVEPGRLWLIDWDGGAIGAGAPTIRLVKLDGEVVFERSPPSTSGPPVIAIPGGLAFQETNRLDLWDAESGRVIGSLTPGPVFPSDVHGHQIAWCESLCRSEHLTTIDGEDRNVRLPSKRLKAFQGYEGRFSPDGRWFAALASDTVGPLSETTRYRIVVIDARTGDVRKVLPWSAPGGYFQGAWSPDSKRFYFSESSYQRAHTPLGQYVVATGRVRRGTLPFGGLHDFLVLDRDDATAMFEAKLGQANQCPAPSVQPSGQTELQLQDALKPCGFRF